MEHRKEKYFVDLILREAHLGVKLSVKFFALNKSILPPKCSHYIIIRVIKEEVMILVGVGNIGLPVLYAARNLGNGVIGGSGTWEHNGAA